MKVIDKMVAQAQTGSKIAVIAASLLAMASLPVSATPQCESADLLHRWSFNGSLVDACGGNTARFDGTGCRARLGPDTLPTDDGHATLSTVSVSVTGSGTVAANGGAPTTSVSLEVARSASITLVASPAEGFLFHRWCGDIHRIVEGGATESTITLDSARDAAIVAEFVSVGEPVTAVWIGTAKEARQWMSEK